jgi:hypothetical protein
MRKRDELEWEKELVTVVRHVMRRRGDRFCNGDGLRLRVSDEMSMEIQSSPYHRNVTVSTRDITWQGIPMRVDHKLPPGCFVFEEGDFDGND